MELKGKKVLFLGDSITEGVGTTNVDKRYTDVFAKLSGANVLNYGVSGTRIARQKVKTDNDFNWDDDFNLRVVDMDKDADLVVVFGGTNDFSHGDAGFGTFEDRDVYTFYGALHTLFEYLSTTYVGANFIIMTPLHRLSENMTVNEIGKPCKPLREYVKAIKEVAEYYSMPVLDLWSESGLQPNVKVNNELFFVDGLHPSDKGAERIAQRLYNFAKNVL